MSLTDENIEKSLIFGILTQNFLQILSFTYTSHKENESIISNLQYKIETTKLIITWNIPLFSGNHTDIIDRFTISHKTM